MSKQLTAFKKAFKQYVDLMELNQYRIIFKGKPLENQNATILTNSEQYWADVTVKATKMDSPPERVAKHEAIHLLLAKFSELGENRHTTELEYQSAEEELVRKLEWLIPDVKEK